MTESGLHSGTIGSGITLYPLTFVPEGGQIIIGRPDIDSFGLFSADAAALVRRLQQDADLAAAGAWYQDAYGETADLAEFVAVLGSLEFIATARPGTAGPGAGSPLRWQRLGRAVFSSAALTGYAGLVLAAAWLMVTVPALRPVPSAVFFSGSVLVVLGVTTVAQAAGVAWHEAFHVLAGRRIGLPSRLSVGRRLYYVVIQTTLAGLMGVPARRRVLPLCAGLIADALGVSLLTGLAEAGRLAGWPPSLGRAAVGLAYLTLLRMLWQAMIFLETDLSHLLACLLRCPDLVPLTRASLRNRYLRWRRRPTARDESGWSDRDRRIARRYAPVVLLGTGLLCGASAALAVPVLAGFLARCYRGLIAGQAGTLAFWDSAIGGLLICGQLAVVVLLTVADRRRRAARHG